MRQYFIDTTGFYVIIKSMCEKQPPTTSCFRFFVNEFTGKRKAVLMLTATALLISLCRPCAGVTDIYRYVDDNGVIHFSNVSVGNNPYKKVTSTVAAKKSVAARQPDTTPPRKQTPLSSSNLSGAYVDIINDACGRHGVDPALVHALVKVESGFNPYAMSRKGAIGLMQLMPETAMVMNVGNSFNPHENVDGGVKYLRYLIDRYEGNLSLALAAYNSGETAVKRWGTIPPYPETQNYVRRIMKLYNGSELAFRPRKTIFMYYGQDGSLMLTDDPSKQKAFRRKTAKNL